MSSAVQQEINSLVACTFAMGDFLTRDAISVSTSAVLALLPGASSIASAAARAWQAIARSSDGLQTRHARLYQLLREVNRAIVSVDNETDLLNEICRAVQTRGGYSLVTIGMLDEAGEDLQLVAHAGEGADYLREVRVSPHRNPIPQCPIDQALRKNRGVVCNAIRDNGPRLPCQEVAIRSGYRSLATFPLRLDGKSRGAMTLYSAEPSFFDTMEVDLLETLADDISYVLQANIHRARQRESEGLLKETEQVLGAILEGSHEAIGISREGRNFFVNEGFLRLFGYASKEDLLGKPVLELIAPDSKDVVRENLARRGHGEDAPVAYVVTALRKDGTTFPMEVHATGYNLNGILHVLVFLRDVTESLKAEQQKESMARFPNEDPRPVLRANRDGLLIFANRASLPIREAWKVESGGSIPEEWKERVRRALATGMEQADVFTSGGRTYSLSVVPIVEQEYANLYGEDVTELRRTVTALQANEELFRTAAQNLSDVVYDWGLKEELAWYGDIDRLLGFPPGEFPRTLSAWRERVHPDDLPRVEQEINKALEGEGNYFTEYRVRQFSGEWHHWTARGTLLYDGNGVPSHWVGSVTDTTESIRLGASLKETERDLRTLSAHMLDAFVSTDMEGRIRECNSAFTALVGYSLDELRHLPYIELTPEFWRESDQAVMREQLIPRGYSDVYEKEYSAKDGSTVPVELRSVLIRDDAGAPVGMWAIVRDITQRKRAGRALRHSEERYRGLFENMREGAAYCQWLGEETPQSDFVFLAVNGAFESLTGFRDAVGKRGTEVFPGLHASDPHIMELFERVVRTGMPERIELYVRTLHMWFAVSAFRPGSGLFVVILDDITARKKWEGEIERLNASLEERIRDRTRQLEVANRELESFSSSVSHDLRAPLRGIDGWSLALLEDFSASLDEKGKSYLARIRSDTQRMGRLIDDLLGLARITRQQINRTTVDLSTLVGTVVGRVREHYPGRMFEFVIHPGMEVEGDPSLLEIVLTNLIDNACKFTGGREVGRIEIGREGTDGVISYFVQDNGAGFAMEHVARLFGAFQRLHRQSEFPGTGIGLALVQRIILRHGGAVWAEAEKGNGAKFSFTL